jgi:hypothetical protein
MSALPTGRYVHRTFKAGKGHVDMGAILGHPYGSMFQVSADGKSLEKLTK